MLTGCSNSPLNRQDLRQSASQIESIAQEAALFSEFVRDGHATNTFSRTNPGYIRELSDDVARTLAESPAESGLSQSRITLQMLTSQLQDRIAAWAATIQDFSSLDDRRREFLKIAGDARRARDQL
jgi:hypothetical protein